MEIVQVVERRYQNHRHQIRELAHNIGHYHDMDIGLVVEKRRDFYSILSRAELMDSHHNNLLVGSLFGLLVD